MSSALEFAMNYEALPLSMRFNIKGSSTMTRNNINKREEDTDISSLAGYVNSSNYNIVDPDTGFTPLINASIDGKLAIVRVLVDRGADLEFREGARLRSALILAAQYGKHEIVEHLLYRGAMVNRTDKYDMTALMHASKEGHFQCIVHLMNRGASLNIADERGYTALHYAARSGHKEILDYLIDAGGAVEIRDNLPEEGKTALHLAAQYARNECIRLLIERGAKINRRSSVQKLTAVMLASKEGNKTTVSLLLSLGADANLVDSFGWSALHFTASWNRKDTTHILLVEGNANVNSRENDISNMKTKEELKNIRYRNKKRKPWEEMEDEGIVGGTTALIIAVKGGHIEIMKLLLNYGADVNLPEMHLGNTPTMVASAMGLTSVLQVLLDYGASVNIKNHMSGTTALMQAARAGQRGTSIILLNHFSDMNILDNVSMSALDHAVSTGNRDLFISVLAQVNPAAKVNLIPWIEMETPRLIRDSESGGPSVFLNSVLYHGSGLYNGLFSLSHDCDMYLIYCLIMLIAACSRSLHKHPYDSPDLIIKINQLDNMIINCLKSESFCLDSNLNDAFILGSVPTSTISKKYDIKYLSGAFFLGPLALYVECGLTKMISNPLMAERINRFLFCCIKDAGPSVLGYGDRTVLNRLRYCPIGMLILECLSKLLFLILIIIKIRGNSGIISGNISGNVDSSDAAIVLFFVTNLLYEFGNIEEKRWAISPSIVFDLQMLESRRWNNCFNHFFSDIWKFCDFCSYILILVWIISIIDSGTISTLLGKNLLSISCIPMSLGLLRYLSLFNDYFGTLILNVFYIAKSLMGFIIIYAITGLGFGVFYYSVFNKDIEEFSSPEYCLQTMFNAILFNYDPNLFNGTTSNYAMGLSVSFVFLLWTIFVLFNSMIAHITFNYEKTWEQSHQCLYLIKFRQIQQFNMSLEKSPFCMLPPPLNLISGALYPFHVYYAWRERLFLDNFYIISLAGYFSDWIILFLTVFPAAVYECGVDIYNSDRYLFGKICMVVSFPFSIMMAVFCILSKQLYDPVPKLALKSKVVDGRLKLSYGKTRDNFENGSLSNFEDERLHKNVELYNFKLNPNRDDIVLPYESSISRDDFDDIKSGNVSVNSKNSSSKKSYNGSYKSLSKIPALRNSTYIGTNVRITPLSPFLQLANVSNVNIVQQSLSMKDKINNERISFKKLNQEESNINALSIWSSSVIENKEEIVLVENSKPDLLLHKSGTINPFQPGFTSAKDIQNFSSVDNDAEYPLQSQIIDNSNSNEEVKTYDYPSIYFSFHKYQPLFNYLERKKIFQEVLPEAFTDQYTVALRDSEIYIQELHDRFQQMETNQDKKLNMILEKLYSS